MDDEAVGILAAIALAVVGLIVVAGAVGGILFVSDAKIGATVTHVECAFRPTGAGSEVTVVTKFPIPGIEHTVTRVDNTACKALVVDRSFAEYYLRSARTVLYEQEGGRCLYDTASLVC